MDLLSNLGGELKTVFYILLLIAVLSVIIIYSSKIYNLYIQRFTLLVLWFSLKFDNFENRVSNKQLFKKLIWEICPSFWSNSDTNTIKIYENIKSKIVFLHTYLNSFWYPEPFNSQVPNLPFRKDFFEFLIKVIEQKKQQNPKLQLKDLWQNLYYDDHAELGNYVKNQIDLVNNQPWNITTFQQKLYFLKYEISPKLKVDINDHLMLPYLSYAIEKIEKHIKLMDASIKTTKIEKFEDIMNNLDEVELIKLAIKHTKNTSFKGFKTNKLPEKYYYLIFDIFAELGKFNDNWNQIKDNQARRINILTPLFGKQIGKGSINSLVSEYDKNEPENEILLTKEEMKRNIIIKMNL